MKWLIFSWALVTGYLPYNSQEITQGAEGVSMNNPGSYSTTFFFSADVIQHFKVWGSIETFMMFDEVDTNGTFYPFEDYYKIGAAVYWKFLEIGVEHECDHGVLYSNQDQTWLGGGYTKFYLRVAGKIEF